MPPTPTPLPTLVSLNEVAKQLGVHTRTVERLVDAGELREYHIGRSVRIDLASVHEYLERQRRRPEEEAATRAQRRVAIDRVVRTWKSEPARAAPREPPLTPDEIERKWAVVRLNSRLPPEKRIPYSPPPTWDEIRAAGGRRRGRAKPPQRT